MKNYIKVLIATLVILLFSNGCASYMVYKNSERKVAVRKAMVTGDKVAIKAVQLGDDGVGIGIDVSNWEALSEQPLLQFGAAVVDAGAIYLGRKGIKAMGDGNGQGGTEFYINGDKNNTTVINGGNNTTSANPDYNHHNVD